MTPNIQNNQNENGLIIINSSDKNNPYSYKVSKDELEDESLSEFDFNLRSLYGNVTRTYKDNIASLDPNNNLTPADLRNIERIN